MPDFLGYVLVVKLCNVAREDLCDFHFPSLFANLAQQGWRTPASRLYAAADSFRSQRDAAGSSSTSGTSTTRARSHSPRLLACGSGRTDEATPSPRMPTITKLS